MVSVLTHHTACGSSTALVSTLAEHIPSFSSFVPYLENATLTVTYNHSLSSPRSWTRDYTPSSSIHYHTGNEVDQVITTDILNQLSVDEQDEERKKLLPYHRDLRWAQVARGSCSHHCRISHIPILVCSNRRLGVID